MLLGLRFTNLTYVQPCDRFSLALSCRQELSDSSGKETQMNVDED